jgi:signal transduction histidine kinase
VALVTSSIRLRITALAAVVMAVLLAVTGVLVVGDHKARLTDQFDEIVEERADAIEDVVSAGPVPRPLPAPDDGDQFAQLTGPGGEVVSATANMEGLPALRFSPGDGDDGRFRNARDLPLDEDDEFRVLSRPVEGAGGRRYVVHVGAEYEVPESTRSLARTLAVMFPAVLAAVALLIWVVVGRALRPVEAIRAEVAGIGAAGLDRRVPQPPGGDEIARLAETMNAMLARLEDSHRRQQRFVADAAHELRSPLTGIRSELEVDLADPDGGDREATERSVLEEVERLSRLVDSLLFLARADAGHEPAPTVAVDLDEIVLREARALRTQRTVTVDTAAVSGAQVRGDADQLTRAVRNLLDNAGRHAGSAVTLGLTEANGWVVLVVADDGPGIPAEAAARIFDRFVRVDDARSRDRGGAGLGLAITREIVQHHRGTIALDGPGGPGARFVIRFPAA